VTREYELRLADADDVDRMVELAAQRRDAYEQFQPRFWRPAVDGRLHQRKYFASLLSNPDAWATVGCLGRLVEGFAIARLMPPPPVYDPGGLACVLDDFTVREAGQWVDLGRLLLEAARDWAVSHGAVQVVVVTAHLDQSKRAALQAAGLSIASEWWIGEAVR
jgi:GNAT superfamily N-acetyltransferase